MWTPWRPLLNRAQSIFSSGAFWVAIVGLCGTCTAESATCGFGGQWLLGRRRCFKNRSIFVVLVDLIQISVEIVSGVLDKFMAANLSGRSRLSFLHLLSFTFNLNSNKC